MLVEIESFHNIELTFLISDQKSLICSIIVEQNHNIY